MNDKTKVVAYDMRWSSDVVEKAEPIIASLLKDGELLKVEGSDNEVLKMLDLTCGIDYYRKTNFNDLVWGIGSRVQVVYDGDKAWNTFTMRKSRDSGAPTEFEKRKYAIEHGGEYPYLMMHVYVEKSTGEVMSLAIARTSDVIDAIENNIGYQRKTGSDQIGQACFFVVPWSDMLEAGYKVSIYDREAVRHDG